MDIVFSVMAGCIKVEIALKEVIFRTSITELCGNMFSSITGKL